MVGLTLRSRYTELTPRTYPLSRARFHRFWVPLRGMGDCPEFRKTLAAGSVKGLRLPPRSPNLNAFAERWVRSVKEECLSHLILFGERSLRKALIQFQEHYHEERNHQGKSNLLLFPAPAPLEPGERRGIRCRERLGGLLRYFYSRAA